MIFTYYYTYKLFTYSFTSNKLNPYQLFHQVSLLHKILMSLLSIATLAFSFIFMRHVFSFVMFYPLALSIKFIPVVLNIMTFTYLLFFFALPTVKSKLPTAYGSSILFLSNLAMTLSSNLYYSFLFSSVKSTELGVLNFTINIQLIKPINSLSALLLTSIVKVQATVLFSSTLLILIVIFSLFLLLNNISLLYMTVTHKISIEFNIMIV